MSEGYVPQVGHLVNYCKGCCNPYLVIYTAFEVVIVASLNGSVEPFINEGVSFSVYKEDITFLADRSAEWARLFDLNTPTP